MKQITQKKLDKLLNKHLNWLYFNKGKRLILTNIDLTMLDLSSKDLTNASFINCDLSYADFCGATLVNVYFQNCSMFNADLSGANLQHATFTDTDLSTVNIIETIGNNVDIITLQLDKYHVTHNSHKICVNHYCYPITKWFNFSDEQLISIGEGKELLSFWNNWNYTIKNSITSHI